MPKSPRKIDDDLDIACMRGDVEEIKKFILEGADICHDHGESFNLAISRYKIDSLNCLVQELEKKDEIVQKKILESAFSDSVLYKNIEAAKYLLDYKPELLRKKISEELVNAFNSGSPVMVKFLINKGADINFKKFNGNNLLQAHFIYYAFPEIELLKFVCKGTDRVNGLRMNEANNEGDYPIHSAMKMLLNHEEILPEPKNLDEVKTKMKEILEIMFEYGADALIKNKDGETALDIIKNKGFPEFETMLVAREKVDVLEKMTESLKLANNASFVEKVTAQKQNTLSRA